MNLTFIRHTNKLGFLPSALSDWNSAASSIFQWKNQNSLRGREAMLQNLNIL
jgi:hypothetical protein